MSPTLRGPINIYPTGINITIPEHNQEAALCLQELTSTLPIQKLSQVHLTDNKYITRLPGFSTISFNL